MNLSKILQGVHVTVEWASGEVGAHAASPAELGKLPELGEWSGMQSVVASLVPLSKVSSGVVRQEIAGLNTLIGKNANRQRRALFGVLRSYFWIILQD